MKKIIGFVCFSFSCGSSQVNPVLVKTSPLVCEDGFLDTKIDEWNVCCQGVIFPNPEGGRYLVLRCKVPEKRTSK
jgi:hypothetical protein